MKLLRTFAVLPLLLLIVLPGSGAETPVKPSGSKAFSLYLGDESLTPEAPLPEDATVNRTLAPLADPRVCQPNSVSALLPPGTVPPTGKACTWTWGKWEVPYPVRFFLPSPADAPYREPTLSLWLNATAPVGLAHLTVSLVKIFRGGQEAALFTWVYDPTAGASASPTGTTLQAAVQAQDPATGAPLLVINNRSVPLTLYDADGNNLARSSMRLDPGESVALKFTKILTASVNATVADPEATGPSVDLQVEFGSPARASVFTAFLESSSSGSNAGVLNLYVEDAETLAPALPTIDEPRRLEIEFGPDANRTENVTLGSVVFDEPLRVAGNALAYLYTQTEYVDPPSPTGKPLLLGSPLRVRLELELVAGTQVITSTADSYNAGVETCNLFGQGTSSALGPPCPYNLYRFALPTAGQTFPAHEPVTLQARFFGLDDPGLSRMYVVFGSAFAPTGVKLPVADEETIDPADLPQPTPPKPNHGVGVSNGTYSLESDRLVTRVPAGSDAVATLTLRNRNESFVKFDVTLGGLPDGHSADLVPAEGTLFPHSSDTVELTVAIADSANLTSFELFLNTTFTPLQAGGSLQPTPVGPLTLTVVVDELASASGDAAAQGREGRGERDALGTGLDADERFKVIGRSHQEAPGLGLMALIVGLVAALAFAPRRTR